MFSLKSLVLVAGALLPTNAHYVFPSLIVNGVTTPEWQNVRMTNNHWSRGPVTDVTSGDFRCYTSETGATASTISVAAGSQLGFVADVAAGGSITHPSVTNVYLAKAPSNVTGWAGDGAVWFKVYQLSAVTDGGSTITFPSNGQPGVTFTIPKSLPNGQYLVRIENIALHGAGSFGGAQFYIACGQIQVTGGGSGTPRPLVAIPGVYTGNEPGILINIYWPIPTSYTQPGPAVWTG